MEDKNHRFYCHIVDDKQEWQAFLNNWGIERYSNIVPLPLENGATTHYKPENFVVPEDAQTLPNVLFLNFENIHFTGKDWKRDVGTFFESLTDWDFMAILQGDKVHLTRRGDLNYSADETMDGDFIDTLTSIEDQIMYHFKERTLQHYPEKNVTKENRIVVAYIAERRQGNNWQDFLTANRDLRKEYKETELEEIIERNSLRVYLDVESTTGHVHQEVIRRIFSQDVIDRLNYRDIVTEDTLGSHIIGALKPGLGNLTDTSRISYKGSILKSGEVKGCMDLLESYGLGSEMLAKLLGTPFKEVIVRKIYEKKIITPERKQEIEKQLGEEVLTNLRAQTYFWDSPLHYNRKERDLMKGQRVHGRNRLFEVDSLQFKAVVKVYQLKGLSREEKKKKRQEYEREKKQMRILQRLTLTDSREYTTYENDEFLFLAMKYVGKQDRLHRIFDINDTIRGLVKEYLGSDPGPEYISSLDKILGDLQQNLEGGKGIANVILDLHEQKKMEHRDMLSTMAQVQGKCPLNLAAKGGNNVEDYVQRVQQELVSPVRELADYLCKHRHISQRRPADWAKIEERITEGVRHLAEYFTTLVKSFYTDAVPQNFLDKRIDHGTLRMRPWPFDLNNQFAYGMTLTWNEIEEQLLFFMDKQEEATREYNDRLRRKLNDPSGFLARELEHDAESGAYPDLADDLQVMHKYVRKKWSGDNVTEGRTTLEQQIESQNKIFGYIQTMVDNIGKDDELKPVHERIQDDEPKKEQLKNYFEGLTEYIGALKFNKTILSEKIKKQGEENIGKKELLAEDFYACHPYRAGMVFAYFVKHILEEDKPENYVTGQGDRRWHTMMSVLDNIDSAICVLLGDEYSSKVDGDGLFDKQTINEMRVGFKQIKHTLTKVGPDYGTN